MSTVEIDYRIADDQEVLAQALADTTAALLRTALDERETASLVVSGGSTPVPFFNALAKEALEWQRVTITLADERWVPADHPDSNEKLVRAKLLTGKASEAQFLSLYSLAADVDETAQQASQRISGVARPFDVVILGMGADGHTASLFPGARNLQAGLESGNPALCLSMQPLTAPHPRITLTLPTLLNTRHLFLHITGQEKRDVLDKAVGQGDTDKAPIAAFFLQDQTPISVYWAP